MQGLFLMVVVYGISKQVVAEEPEAKEETSESAKKIKPGDYKLEEVLNNPSFIRQPFCYVGDGWTGKEYVDDDILSRMLFTCFVDDMEETDNITEPLIANFSEWIDDRKREIQGYPQFRKEVQEDPHEVMLTGDNFNNKLDPFVSFMAGHDSLSNNSILKYPYFFKGSVKKDLSIKGVKIGGFTSYTYPKGVDVFSEPGVDDLDKQLKPVWFRDATKKDKSYKKVSMKYLHDITEFYRNLLGDKIIKYVLVTYQCEKDHILVSFKTDNFDIPPQIDEEEEFKRRFKANPGRALYRGIKNGKLFEDMKKKGVAGHARKHNEQWFGPGVYWTKDYEQALGFACNGDVGVVAMAIACDDFPDIIKYAASEQLYKEVFLMRDNQCVFIKKTAMCVVNKGYSDLVEKKKKSPEYKNVVFCETDKEVEDWLNCK